MHADTWCSADTSLNPSYGGRGSIILHQVLFAIYPPRILAAAQPLFAPLNVQAFLHSVLVPEAALALTMEDMPKKSRAEALKIMRASSRYGSLMFPDDGVDGAGDEMMREQAKRRREEIEKEEAHETSGALQERVGMVSNTVGHISKHIKRTSKDLAQEMGSTDDSRPRKKVKGTVVLPCEGC